MLILCSNTKKRPTIFANYSDIIVFKHRGCRVVTEKEFVHRLDKVLTFAHSFKKLAELYSVPRFGKACLFIPGGNTYNLINCIDNRFFRRLVIYCFNNDIDIVAESAGAIIFGANIDPARIPEEGADTNDCKTTKKAGLGFLPKVIFPHWQEKYQMEVVKYLLDKNLEGITIKEGEIKTFDRDVLNMEWK